MCVLLSLSYNEAIETELYLILYPSYLSIVCILIESINQQSCEERGKESRGWILVGQRTAQKEMEGERGGIEVSVCVLS